MFIHSINEIFTSVSEFSIILAFLVLLFFSRRKNFGLNGLLVLTIFVYDLIFFILFSNFHRSFIFNLLLFAFIILYLFIFKKAIVIEIKNLVSLIRKSNFYFYLLIFEIVTFFLFTLFLYLSNQIISFFFLIIGISIIFFLNMIVIYYKLSVNDLRKDSLLFWFLVSLSRLSLLFLSSPSHFSLLYFAFTILPLLSYFYFLFLRKEIIAIEFYKANKIIN